METNRIETKLGGTLEAGHYSVKGNLVTVTYRGASITAEIGQWSVEPIARMLLGQLVAEGRPSD